MLRLIPLNCSLRSAPHFLRTLIPTTGATLVELLKPLLSIQNDQNFEYGDFPNQRNAQEETQYENEEQRQPGIMSSEYQMVKPESSDDESTRTALERSERRSGKQRKTCFKSFVPCIISGSLYFAGRDDGDESSFKGAAKCNPSVTSLNRELSTVIFTYEQLYAIFGPQTMRSLIDNSKTGSASGKNKQLKTGITQEEHNKLRNALETLSHVDAKTLRKQHERIGPLKNHYSTQHKVDIENLRKVLGLSAEKSEENRVFNPRANGETINRAAALKDEIAMAATDQTAQENEMQPLESLKEIQGAAELCIRPSKVSLAKSDHELNAKYAALL
ncbi:hypothetical protein Y032_0031g2310 [Ancylostoma ceylanicum]|uniref:Uncharacterized protein n=1 Tax=Ancylostoma ceylanicum TaxID=53326 RepID=A0A016URN7_9BILA|nr:hypothetical protein Y032_0031g2310 [Ancylostoma ceylanicum]